tara:strand:- start:630 stop:1340 length:711 start_codon:yes stop_codon:yes gene_type:complete
MKKNLIVLSLILLSNIVFSQKLLPNRYGLEIGTNLSNIISVSNEGVKNINASNIIGFTAGFNMHFPMNEKWSINPSIHYSQNGSSITFSYIHDYEINQRDFHEVTSEVNLAYTKLNIPFSYNCSPKLSLNLGPYISYLVSANYNEISDVTSNQNINSNNTLPDSQFSEEDIDYGIIAGISYYISDDLMILSSYNSGISDLGVITKQTYTGSNNNSEKINSYNLKNSNITFSIVYLF